MAIDDGIQMIKEIYNKQHEEKAYRLYTSIYPNMTKETYVTFEEFYKPQQRNVESTDTKSAEEILKEVQETMNSNEWG